jgi:hypothetical protein
MSLLGALGRPSKTSTTQSNVQELDARLIKSTTITLHTITALRQPCVGSVRIQQTGKGRTDALPIASQIPRAQSVNHAQSQLLRIAVGVVHVYSVVRCSAPRKPESQGAQCRQLGEAAQFPMATCMSMPVAASAELQPCTADWNVQASCSSAQHACRWCLVVCPR